MKNFKIFGVDMGGFHIDKNGNYLSYMTRFSDYFLNVLEKIVNNSKHNVLIRDLRRSGLTTYLGDNHKISFDKNWELIYEIVLNSFSSKKDRKKEQHIITDDLQTEDLLHLLTPTSEHFKNNDINKYIKQLKDQINKNQVDIIITDTYIAWELADYISKNDENCNIWLVLEKDKDDFGCSQNHLWKEWWKSCQKADFSDNVIYTFADTSIVEYNFSGTIKNRPRNYTTVLNLKPK